MRLRKKPKLVDAVQVKDILANSPWPDWLQRAVTAGKITVQRECLTTHIGRQIKTAYATDWIAYDIAQQMVYCVTDRTIQSDYEQVGSHGDE